MRLKSLSRSIEKFQEMCSVFSSSTSALWFYFFSLMLGFRTAKLTIDCLFFFLLPFSLRICVMQNHKWYFINSFNSCCYDIEVCALGARNDRPMDHCKLWLTLDTLLINYETVLCCLFDSTMLYCWCIRKARVSECVWVASASPMAVHGFLPRRSAYVLVVTRYIWERARNLLRARRSPQWNICVHGRCCAQNRLWFPFGIGGGAMWAQMAIDNTNNKAFVRLDGCVWVCVGNGHQQCVCVCVRFDGTMHALAQVYFIIAPP